LDFSGDFSGYLGTSGILGNLGTFWEFLRGFLRGFLGIEGCLGISGSFGNLGNFGGISGNYFRGIFEGLGKWFGNFGGFLGTGGKRLGIRGRIGGLFRDFLRFGELLGL